jgi:hypothetical protein
MLVKQGILKGKYNCTVDLLFDWFGISCMTTVDFCFYLQNRLIQNSQTGGQRYTDTLAVEHLQSLFIPYQNKLECLSLILIFVGQ